MEETGKRILCLGDSNTYGYDPRGAMGGRYPKDVRWTSRLGEAGLTVFNRGMNGSTVPVESQYGAFSELIASVQPLGAVTGETAAETVGGATQVTFLGPEYQVPLLSVTARR